MMQPITMACVRQTGSSLSVSRTRQTHHNSCDVVHHTLLLHQPPLVCLIHQLQQQATCQLLALHAACNDSRQPIT